METKFMKPASGLLRPLKQWIDKIFRKRDNSDNFFDNPYAVL